MHRRLAIAVNVALRVALVIFLADAIVNADDSRFAGKGIGTRGLIILPLSLVLPALYLTRRPGSAISLLDGQPVPVDLRR